MYQTTARDDAFEGRALVAAFADRESARTAAHRLHEEGFHKIWLGVTHRAADVKDSYAPDTSTTTATTPVSNDLVVESADDSVVDRIGRFFSGDAGKRSLYDELVRHGVDSNAAGSIERSLLAESAILTVDGSNHPELAAKIVEDCDGHLLAGESFAATSLAGQSSKEELRGSQVLGYGESARYARGSEIDEERRLRLRAERLDVAKQRESSGVATVGKEVIEKQNELDVPLVREELFVERRPSSANSDVPEDTTPIGEAETIRIPLMRERVVVTRRPVVTDEYVVGKRQVDETQHVSETTREEKLAVDDGTRGIKDAAPSKRAATSATT